MGVAAICYTSSQECVEMRLAISRAQWFKSVTTNPNLLNVYRFQWAAPSVGLFKLNSDASCCGDGVTGLGGVVRDCNGDVLVATCLKIQGEMGVNVAEAMAARHLVVISIDWGFNKLILESDCRLILVR
uniref:RNase H type-1 domain-containing protein n=1 Tax=Chenopodium quinoa TaxID=63459 RepID=A0A803MDT3_CHEQI